jgi:HAD superfamily hydrolase (TIGR01549 family)
MTIDTLFLDAGGVLVFPNWARVSEALAQHGVFVAADALAAAEPRAKQRLDVDATIGSTTDRQRGWLYFDLVLTEAGLALSGRTDAALAGLQAYHAAHNLWETVPADVPPALDRLRGLGLKLVVVSNANGTLRAKFAALGLDVHVDALVDSCDEGVEKPDPRLFQIALARAGGRPEATVHVGDLYYVDVVGARNAGLRGGVLLDAANLYEGYDCVRVPTLDALADAIAHGRV